jgi:GTP-sensing pleiotropic transcriptional regulator CodY
MSYTEELTKSVIEEYEADPSRETVDRIAERIGKTTRSVIAKLAAAGVYQTPQRTTKTGEPIVKKETLVEEIEGWLEIECPTLVKTGKEDLKRVHKVLQEIFVDA